MRSAPRVRHDLDGDLARGGEPRAGGCGVRGDLLGVRQTHVTRQPRSAPRPRARRRSARAGRRSGGSTSSASRYSSGSRSRRSASSDSARTRASGVRSSCESSAENRRSCRRLAATRSSSPSSVAASSVSSSWGGPRAKRWSRSCSLHSAACRVIRTTGRSEAATSQRTRTATTSSTRTPKTIDAIRAAPRVASYGESETPATTVPTRLPPSTIGTE